MTPLFRWQHLPTFEPFLTILGKGLVTSHGELWKNQRRIIGVGFVGDMLDIAMYRGFEAGSSAHFRVHFPLTLSSFSVERLSKRMDEFRAAKKPMELDEEFRRMAIGVIGQVGDGFQSGMSYFDNPSGRFEHGAV